MGTGQRQRSGERVREQGGDGIELSMVVVQF